MEPTETDIAKLKSTIAKEIAYCTKFYNENWCDDYVSNIYAPNMKKKENLVSLGDNSLAIQLFHDCDMYLAMNFTHSGNPKVYLSTQFVLGENIDLYEYQPEYHTDTSSPFYSVDIKFSMARAMNPDIVHAIKDDNGRAYPLPIVIRITDESNFGEILVLERIFFINEIRSKLIKQAA